MFLGMEQKQKEELPTANIGEGGLRKKTKLRLIKNLRALIQVDLDEVVRVIRGNRVLMKKIREEERKIYTKEIGTQAGEEEGMERREKRKEEKVEEEGKGRQRQEKGQEIWNPEENLGTRKEFERKFEEMLQGATEARKGRNLVIDLTSEGSGFTTIPSEEEKTWKMMKEWEATGKKWQRSSENGKEKEIERKMKEKEKEKEEKKKTGEKRIRTIEAEGTKAFRAEEGRGKEKSEEGEGTLRKNKEGSTRTVGITRKEQEEKVREWLEKVENEKRKEEGEKKNMKEKEDRERRKEEQEERGKINLNSKRCEGNMVVGGRNLGKIEEGRRELNTKEEILQNLKKIYPNVSFEWGMNNKKEGREEEINRKEEKGNEGNYRDKKGTGSPQVKEVKILGEKDTNMEKMRSRKHEEKGGRGEKRKTERIGKENQEGRKRAKGEERKERIRALFGEVSSEEEGREEEEEGKKKEEKEINNIKPMSPILGQNRRVLGRGMGKRGKIRINKKSDNKL